MLLFLFSEKIRTVAESPPLWKGREYAHARRGKVWLYPAWLLLLAMALTAWPTCNLFAAERLEKVVLQLRWRHQFQFAGYYAARQQGYYREAGLDVDIKEGGLGISAIEQVWKGKAQYGVTNSEILLHRLQKKPLVVLAAIFQHSPLVLVSQKSKGITTPQDLVGKKVKMTSDSRDVELQAMLLNEGVPLQLVNVYDAPVTREDYFDPSFSALSAYLTNEPYYLEEAGMDYVTIRPITYGIDFYGDCLFTSEKEIEDHSERVKAFRAASLKGWRYAMRNPGALIELIIKQYGARKSREHLVYEADAMRQLIMPELVELGHMNPGRWRHIADTFVRFGWAKPGYDLEGFLYDPDPKVDYRHLKWFLGVAVALTLVAALASLVLYHFNSTLKKEVDRRKLSQEELRQSEERFRFLADSTFEAIFLIRNGVIAVANRAAGLMFAAPRAELVGMPVHELLAPESAGLALAMLELPEAGPFEAKARRKDGVMVDVEIQTKNLSFNDEPHKVVAVRDITHRKRREDERLLKDKLQAAVETAGAVCHELNQPLQVISCRAELSLMDRSLDEATVRSLESILAETRRLANLTVRLQNLTDYRTKHYLEDRKILDLDRSTS